MEILESFDRTRCHWSAGGDAKTVARHVAVRESWREADSSIPLATQSALRSLEWVGRAENLSLIGPSGTGKSHFVEAVAHAVIDAGMRVSWFSLESLTATIGRAKVDASVRRIAARICRSELIVIDDIGIAPGRPGHGRGVHRVVDSAYERRSVAVTSNMHPSGFDTIVPKTFTTATVDRLLHHAHLVPADGGSPRLRSRRRQGGSRPWAEHHLSAHRDFCCPWPGGLMSAHREVRCPLTLRRITEFKARRSAGRCNW